MFVGAARRQVLGSAGLAAVLDAVRDHFTLAKGAEVITEANPESTSPEFFARIRAAGYTRVSLGMQSVAPHVLAVLDRVHSPGLAPAAAREARAAGFDHVNIDLIYGTPGSPTTTCGARSTPPSTPTSTTCPATRWWSRTAPRWRDGAARRDLGARRRRARSALRAARRSAVAGRARLVRGLQLELSRRRVSAQPRLLGWRRMVGRGARGARLRLLDPLVECQAPQCLFASTGGWTVAGGRLRGDRPRCPPHRRGDAGLRLRGGLPSTADRRERVRAESVVADGLVYIMAIGWCRPTVAGSSPTPWCEAARRLRAASNGLGELSRCATDSADPNQRTQARAVGHDRALAARSASRGETEQAAPAACMHDAHGPPLLRYVLRLTSGDRQFAEDVVQERCCGVAQARILEQPSESVRAWLFTVAKNLVIDDRRSARYHRESQPEFMPERSHRRDRSGVREMDTSDALTPLARTIVRPSSGPTISAKPSPTSQPHEQIPPGTVNSRLHYALRALRIALQERGLFND